MASSKLMIVAASILMGSAVGYSAPAFCQPQQASPAAGSSDDASAVPSFNQLDTKHHGYLVRSDIPKHVESLMALRMHFADYDKNGNGRLDNTEYATYVASLGHHNQASGASPPQTSPMH